MRRDAGAGVPHLQPRRRQRAAQRQQHAALIRVADGIGHQVAQDALHHHAVRRHPGTLQRAAGPQAQPQPLVVHGGAGLHLHVGQQFVQAHRLRHRVQAAPVQQRQVEQVVEQAVDGGAGLDDARRQVVHLARVLLQHVGVQPQCVHRLADVVRGHGQKAPARVQRLLQVGTARLQRIDQQRVAVLQRHGAQEHLVLRAPDVHQREPVDQQQHQHEAVDPRHLGQQGQHHRVRHHQRPGKAVDVGHQAGPVRRQRGDGERADADQDQPADHQRRRGALAAGKDQHRAAPQRAVEGPRPAQAAPEVRALGRAALHHLPCMKAQQRHPRQFGRHGDGAPDQRPRAAALAPQQGREHHRRDERGPLQPAQRGQHVVHQRGVDLDRIGHTRRVGIALVGGGRQGRRVGGRHAEGAGRPGGFYGAGTGLSAAGIMECASKNDK